MNDARDFVRVFAAVAEAREQARQQERAAVVADIRAQAIKQTFEPIERHLWWLADRIERGDHSTERTTSR